LSGLGQGFHPRGQLRERAQLQGAGGAGDLVGLGRTGAEVLPAVGEQALLQVLTQQLAMAPGQLPGRPPGQAQQSLQPARAVGVVFELATQPAYQGIDRALCDLVGFATNALILACAVLAYNILRWIGQNGPLGPDVPPRPAPSAGASAP